MLNTGHAPCSHTTVISNQYQYWVWWQPARHWSLILYLTFYQVFPASLSLICYRGLTPTSCTLNKFFNIQINSDNFLSKGHFFKFKYAQNLLNRDQSQHKEHFLNNTQFNILSTVLCPWQADWGLVIAVSEHLATMYCIINKPWRGGYNVWINTPHTTQYP